MGLPRSPLANLAGLPLSSAAQAKQWLPPWKQLDLGGCIAVWAEQGDDQSPAAQVPWLVLHGGPGGRTSSAHVLPLRQLGLPWFGFDQRNSGESEDLELQEVDTQRCLDDALAVADSLGIERFHVLGGSWGGTLAIAMAAYRPERVSGVVLRAPFLPWPARVDAFFHDMEQAGPDLFAVAFGAGARTQAVCQAMLSAQGEQAGLCAQTWYSLEMAVLNPAAVPVTRLLSVSNQTLMALQRKYRLQSHFLLHDCFMSANDWWSAFSTIQAAGMPVALVQGQQDRVCPPAGAVLLSEMWPGSELFLLPHGGHLPDSAGMADAVAKAVRWVTQAA